MPKRLLLADDSITIQKVVGITFAQEDYDIVYVDNGLDAIKRAAEVRPDIILADIVMPKKNGYEVCEAIKKDPTLKHIPVLLLAGTFETFDVNRGKLVGANDYIIKPFESQALIDKVNGLITSAGPGKAAAPATIIPPPPAAPAAAPAAAKAVHAPSLAAAPAGRPVPATPISPPTTTFASAPTNPAKGPPAPGDFDYHTNPISPHSPSLAVKPMTTPPRPPLPTTAAAVPPPPKRVAAAPAAFDLSADFGGDLDHTGGSAGPAIDDGKIELASAAEILMDASSGGDGSLAANEKTQIASKDSATGAEFGFNLDEGAGNASATFDFSATELGSTGNTGELDLERGNDDHAATVSQASFVKGSRGSNATADSSSAGEGFDLSGFDPTGDPGGFSPAVDLDGSPAGATADFNQPGAEAAMGLDLPPLPDTPGFATDASVGADADFGELPPLPGGDYGADGGPGPTMPMVSESEMRAAVEKRAQQIVERVVWEVVPEVAERMIQQEIQRLTGEVATLLGKNNKG